MEVPEVESRAETSLGVRPQAVKREAPDHAPNPDAVAVFGDSILYVNLEECTSCTACYQPDVCPVGAIYSEEHLPDGSAASAKYNAEDPNKGHDHTFFVQHSRDVFAD